METISNPRTPRPMGRGYHGVLRFWLALLLPATAFAAGLNDTGQDQCAAFDGTNWSMVACAVANTGDGSSYPRQDGRYGRDAAASAGVLPKMGGGSAGFDFTKIANNGSELPANASLGSNATDWACTRDNVTGLMWEVKTATANTDLRYFGHRYTWYSDDDSSNGFDGTNQATARGSLGTNTTCNNTLTQCHTQAYVAAVNALSTPLCGYRDWRLPSRQELPGLVHFGVGPPIMIDPGYFPNTQSWGSYWTATTWSADAWLVDFGNGVTYYRDKTGNYDVRLVRGGQ